jgi:hypothetical protein
MWHRNPRPRLHVVAGILGCQKRTRLFLPKFILLACSLLTESEEKNLTGKLHSNMFPRLLGVPKT